MSPKISYDGEGKPRMKVTQCLALVPWLVLLTVGLFIVGVVFWMAGTVKTRDETRHFADVLGVDAGASKWLYDTATTIMVALTIGSCAIVGVALLLSVVRSFERGLLFGFCGGNSDAPPEPWLFKGYQIITIILNTLVWLLLLVCVVLLAAMFLWWGGFEAIKNAIDTGVSAADAALQPTGVSLNDASTLSSRIVSALSASDSSLASIFGAAGLPFTPVCAPTCLNVGSFASLLRMSQSCVCGDALLDAARGASARGATSAAVGLAGAAAMWLASCLLLVILTSHHVTAEFDRRSAAFLKEQRAEQYDHGFAANPKDCLPVTYEEAVKDQRQPALM